MNRARPDSPHVVSDGNRTRVLRESRPTGPVVLKQIRSPWPDRNDLKRLNREHSLLLLVDGHGAPKLKAKELSPIAQLVLEDVGGISLDRMMVRLRSSAAHAMLVAVNLTDALASVHSRGVIHRDVNPSNAIVHPDTHAVWLIDFDLAVEASAAPTAPRNEAQGTAPYMAPEQTGRLNRAVDDRTDLYGLGVTLYELFAGHRPFEGADLLAYTYAHLALAAPNLTPAIDGLPEGLVSLVLTLLNKSPDDRYQSAAGVALDLRELQRHLEDHQPVLLRGRALGRRAELSHDIAGRDKERALLQSAFSRSSAGARTLALVSGSAGIGKTSVVRELSLSAALANGRMLSGKFDQFSRDVPLAGFVQPLEQFASELLAAPSELVDTWRERFFTELGANAAVLTELSAQWLKLLGEQAPADELAPNASERRLQDTIRRTFALMTADAHPLVLFLDDLQWADLPSLRVLEALFQDRQLAHTMLVLAWRGGEIDADHALVPTVDVLKAASAEVCDVVLGPLSAEDVTVLVAQALQRPPESVAALGALLTSKTNGNPFFLRRLFEEAAKSGAITRDDDGRWQFSVEAAQKLPATDNVVEFLQEELQRLGPSTRALLSAAALLGDGFDLATLESATASSASELASDLAAAISGRFLRPLDDDYWSSGIGEGQRFRFAFVHDRVQEAAKDLVSEQAQIDIHVAVARTLLAAPDELESNIFRAAEHCSAGLTQFSDAERPTVLDVLQRAGRRAFRGASYGPAHKFLEAAIKVARGEEWQRDPNAAKDLWSLSARAAWLVGRRDLQDQRIAALHNHARDVVDRLSAQEIVVQARISAGELHEALDAALEVLAEAGVHLARHPSADDVKSAIGATLADLAGKRIDTLPDLADATANAQELAVRRLLVRISSAAYVAEGNLLPLIACHIVQSTLINGANSASSYGFAVFALCLGAGWMLPQGVEHGDNALMLLERFPDAALDGTVRHVVNHYAQVWREPLTSVYEQAPNVYRSLIRAGDLEFAGWVHHFRVVYGFFAGVPLDGLSTASTGVIESMRISRVDAALACTMPMEMLIRALTGRLDDPSRLVGPDYDEVESRRALSEAHFDAATLVLSVCALYARVVFGKREEAAQAARAVEASQHGAMGTFYQVPMRVLAAIALLDQAAHQDTVEASVAHVLPWREALHACATANPSSGTHHLALFDAEIAAARGDLSSAIRLYDQAIDSAATNSFVHDEALANERAGRFHLTRGARRIARAYLLDARVAWERWGATAKVAHLDATFGDLVVPLSYASGTGLLSSLSSTSSSSTSGRRGQELDVASLLKASHAIAEEIGLSGLLTRSMHILLENVGATRAVLLLSHRGTLSVRALGTANEEVSSTLNVAFEDGKLVPPSIVRRVWRRGETETYDDVRDAPGATSDTYLAGLSSGEAATGISVLCARFSHQGKPLGVLYFENSLAVGAFVEDRVHVVHVLAPQLAISVRNTLLSEAQSRFVPSQYIRSLDREDIVDVELGDHRATEVTVFFSDIRGFTSTVEQMQPSEALQFINSYLAYAEPAITECGGFVDSYLGDGIMALFDNPELNAEQAVRAAIAMHHALDRFNAERVRCGRPPVRTGIGLNTGRVILGTIGGPNAMKCGVVGDAVNLASRVEGLTQHFGTRLLISDTTFGRIGRASPFTLRSAGRVRVKGRHQPVTVYEVVDAEPPATQDALRSIHDVYEEAWALFLAGEPAEARVGFASCLTKVPGDLLSARYMMRAMELETNGVPVDWDGTEQM